MSGGIVHLPVRIPSGGVILDGDVRVPVRAHGLVVFAHGSGSSRHSPRNRFVAEALHEAGFATLLLDLLTPSEEAADRAGASLRFDVGLLSRRLADAVTWARSRGATANLPVGLFGASTGAAAALLVAATEPQSVAAVVSRGGRTDLAGSVVGSVRAPTRLVVGERDGDVLALNRRTFSSLRCRKDLLVVPGATHLFEESGALERVATAAADWFTRHLAAKRPEPAATS